MSLGFNIRGFILQKFLVRACPQTLLEGLCFALLRCTLAYQNNTPLHYDHEISEMANQI